MSSPKFVALLHSLASTGFLSSSPAGILAVIRVASEPGWTSRTRVDVVDEQKSFRFRYMYGVKVTFKTSGTFGFVDFNTCLINLSAGLVRCLDTKSS